jgi:tetratricopeptide (TPR) repeat protein
MNSLAGVLKIQGDLAGAETLFRQALTIQRQVLPPAHPSMASGLTGLGAVLTQTDRAEEALPLLREALEIRTTRLVPHHWLTAVTASALGECLTKLEQFDEAEQLLLEAHKTLRHDRGEQHERTLEARERLAALYDDWHQPDKAVAVRDGE